MINFIQGLAFCGIIIGIAGTAGSIEQNESPLTAIIILIISFIVMTIFITIEDAIERRKHGKHYRIY